MFWKGGATCIQPSLACLPRPRTQRSNHAPAVNVTICIHPCKVHRIPISQSRSAWRSLRSRHNLDMTRSFAQGCTMVSFQRAQDTDFILIFFCFFFFLLQRPFRADFAGGRALLRVEPLFIQEHKQEQASRDLWSSSGRLLFAYTSRTL